MAEARRAGAKVPRRSGGKKGAPRRKPAKR
ncbi:MAG: hypothetical protein ACM36B_13140 [Bacteroidota bacterium]